MKRDSCWTVAWRPLALRSLRNVLQWGLLLVLCAVSFLGCATLEVPFRYLGLRRQPLRVVSDISLPRDIASDHTIWVDRVDSSSPGAESYESRHDLLRALENSIDYLQSRKASADYKRQGSPQFHPDTVLASLLHFRTLLLTSRSPGEFEQRVREDFMFFRSIGSGSRGKVLYTAYCQPEYDVSLTPTADFSYPIFRKPEDFSAWRLPHPTRTELEGVAGRGGKGTRLNGEELLFVRSRFDALFIQIQGSARVRLPGGKLSAIGFDGATSHPFTSVARLLIKDRYLTADQANASGLESFAARSPDVFNYYVSRNNRFVFFRFMPDSLPRGSIGVPVTQGRSIATDKSLMPPGALAIARASLPFGPKALKGSRFVLDQDTGSAIKGPGRVDFFAGSGDDACAIAGRTLGDGDLFYLLLRDPTVELAYLSGIRHSNPRSRPLAFQLERESRG